MKGPFMKSVRKPVLARALLSKKTKYPYFCYGSQNFQYEPFKKELAFIFCCEYNTLTKNLIICWLYNSGFCGGVLNRGESTDTFKYEAEQVFSLMK